MYLQVLYIDTLFFVNLVMDLLSLYLVSLLLHLRRRVLRLLLASAIGALYAVLAVLFSIHPIIHICLSVLLSVLLVSVGYRDFGSGGRFFGAVLLFYLGSILLGGAIEALFHLVESVVSLRTDATLRASDLVLLLGFASFALIYAATRFFGNAPLKKMASVRLTLAGKSVTLPLLVDSGCLLSDPISGRAAILVRLEAVASILPGEVITCARASGAHMPRDVQSARRCRLIPAEVLGAKHLLLSIRMDEVALIPERKARAKPVMLDVFVSLYPTTKNHFGGFEGLLPSSLLIL